MNEADLQRIGNAKFARHLQPPAPPADLNKSDANRSDFLQVESNLDPLHLDVPNDNLNLSSILGNQQPHDFKCTKLVKTKWDDFAAYSFNKLSQQQKDRTFLQLYDDYRATKKYLNEELHKHKRIATKMHAVENQLLKAKNKNSEVHLGSKNKTDKAPNLEVDGLKLEVKRLHEKILALTGNKNKLVTRPKTANKSQKVIIPVNENLRGELESERKHIRELLLIIDELKKNKFIVQSQLKQQQSNQPQTRPQVNQSKVKGINSQSQFHQYANDLHNWKSKYGDLQLAYNRMNEDKDRRIKELSTELINIKENSRMRQKLERRGNQDMSNHARLEQRIKQVSDEKQKLQTEIRRLVQMPFYQNNKQIVDTQQKLVAVEAKYQTLKSQFSKLSETSTKYFSQLQFKNRENALLKTENDKFKKQIKESFEKQYSKMKSNKSASSDIDFDDYYRKKLALVKLEGDDLIWKQFQAIAKPEIKSMKEADLRVLAQSLWLSKIQLLAHLQKAQVELRTLKQGVDSRFNLQVRQKQLIQQQLKITRARLDEWKSMQNVNHRKPYQVFQQNGIKYNDSTSVFDTEESENKELESNENYFDLYLGHLNIDESELMKNPQNKVKNTTHFISFLTVDFYNHETQHSNFVEGVMKKLGNNYSFKVEVNSYFLKYLSKNSISIELWSPQGTATVLLGKGEIYLADLINNSAQDISSVLRGKSQIYCERRLIATVEYRLRMRLPITPFIEWAESKNEFKLAQARDPYMAGRKRMLEIYIQKAEGLPIGINAFVYFNVQEQDFFTEPDRGPTPCWNFRQAIDVNVDELFVDELKQKYFQFTIFDDEKEVNEDVYGIAKANFTPLVQFSDQLDLTIDIEDRNGLKNGKLKVKAKWLSF